MCRCNKCTNNSAERRRYKKNKTCTKSTLYNTCTIYVTTGNMSKSGYHEKIYMKLEKKNTGKIDETAVHKLTSNCTNLI